MSWTYPLIIDNIKTTSEKTTNLDIDELFKFNFQYLNNPVIAIKMRRFPQMDPD